MYLLKSVFPLFVQPVSNRTAIKNSAARFILCIMAQGYLFITDYFIPEYYVSSLFRIRFSIYCLTKLENYLTKILGEGVYFYIFVKINQSAQSI